MKNIDGNFTKTPNQILDALMKSKLNGTQCRTILTVIRYTHGFNRKNHALSVGFISKATGVHRQLIKKELTTLIEMKILTLSREATFSKPRIIEINENINEWVVDWYEVSNEIPGTELDTTPGTELDTTPGTELDTKERKEKDKSKETGFLEKSSSFRYRYNDFQLQIIDEFLEIIKSTRKNNKVADTVILKIYQELDKYEVNRVIQGLKTFVDNPRHHEKAEKYAIGIVRNSKVEPEKPKTADFIDDNPFLNRRLKNYDPATDTADNSIPRRDSLQ